LTPDEYAYAYRTVANRITTYLAPPSCRRLPLLRVGLRQFLECQKLTVDDWRFGYMPLDSPRDFEYDSENDSDNDSEHGEYYYISE